MNILVGIAYVNENFGYGSGALKGPTFRKLRYPFFRDAPFK